MTRAVRCWPPMCQNQLRWPASRSPFWSAPWSPARAHAVSHWIAACMFALSPRARSTASSCPVPLMPASTPLANARK